MTTNPLTSAAVEQLQWHWQNLLRPRLEGLTDEELLWDPTGDDQQAWTVHSADEQRTAHQAGAGDLVIDFDLVEQSLRMPGMSGLELLRKLKEMAVSLPVIVITGHGDVPLAVEAMKSGAADFIEKPFVSDAFVEVVKRALELHATALELLLAADE